MYAEKDRQSVTATCVSQLKGEALSVLQEGTGSQVCLFRCTFSFYHTLINFVLGS